jgi:hypothetical protein
MARPGGGCLVTTVELLLVLVVIVDAALGLAVVASAK